MKKTKYNKNEEEIVKYVEDGSFKPFPEKKQKELKKVFKEAAGNTTAKNKTMNIRVSETDLSKIKAKAIEAGIPYQTIVGSLIHQYVEGKIELKI